MTPEDHRKAIEHIVNERYSPQLSAYLVDFLQKYSDLVQEQIAWSKVFGRPIAQTPVKLDLRDLHTQLINDLVSLEIILGSKKENEKSNV